ncbi:MAG: pyridoxamine 5'-phosphate oxidase [Thermoanaerobaculia bacterium]|nr:pyridoxamine 5'-phosphate oxidase [Thermoanaerobaculia bacterium]
MIDPIELFKDTFRRAEEASRYDASATTLATATSSGEVSARIVLVKRADAEGFYFFTNYRSRKARQLAENPKAALVFFWPELGEQIRVEGAVQKLPTAESDRYWAERPRDSQLGGLASEQSQPLESRERLLARVAEVESQFEGRTVPRPEYWGGYLLVPQRIEFWSNGDHRLHDRRLFKRRSGTWTESRLYP